MNTRVIGFSVDDSVGYIEAACLLRYEDVQLQTGVFESVYKYEVLVNYNRADNVIHSIEVNGADKLLEVIDNKDCLPDVGLLDYKDDELGIDIKNVSLRELYKVILNITLK